MERQKENLIDFLISLEKDSINSYHGECNIESEENKKKQLYLYYILHKRILGNWNCKNWNFGVYNGKDYPKVKTIFNEKLVYQLFNKQWRYNVGYEIGSGFWIQDNYDNKRNYISELIKWANK
ncbi:MAG: hypothetical protein SGI89_14260 [bacterium]|nr:hypothetical protein [bacterium]